MVVLASPLLGSGSATVRSRQVFSVTAKAGSEVPTLPKVTASPAPPQAPKIPAPPARENGAAVHIRSVPTPTTTEGAGSGHLTVLSTAYSVNCGGGWITASGEPVAIGVVAMNMLPLGSHIRILTGPLAGYVATVLDRIGWGTDLDVWMASCWEARQYGKQVVQIQVG